MIKRTTTKQLNTAITNNILYIKKAEIYYKTSKKTEIIDADKFKENLDFLCESGIFADFIDWHYERNLSAKDGYILDSGSMNPFAENIVTVYLGVCNGACRENVEKALSVSEGE